MEQNSANNSIFEKFDQASKAPPSDALKLFYEMLRAIHQEDENGILSLWQAYKSLGLKKSNASKEFEKAILARMEGILWGYQKDSDTLDSSSWNSKERSKFSAMIASFKTRIQTVTGYKVEFGHKIEKSFFQKLFEK